MRPTAIMSRRCCDDGDEARGRQVGDDAGGDAFRPVGERRADGEAGADHPERVAQDDAHDVGVGGAERYANTDFVSATRNGVGEQAVQADDGEQCA